MQGPIQNLNEHLASPFVNNGFANATKRVPSPLCAPFRSCLPTLKSLPHLSVSSLLACTPMVLDIVLCAAS